MALCNFRYISILYKNIFIVILNYLHRLYFGLCILAFCYSWSFTLKIFLCISCSPSLSLLSYYSNLHNWSLFYSLLFLSLSHSLFFSFTSLSHTPSLTAASLISLLFFSLCDTVLNSSRLPQSLVLHSSLFPLIFSLTPFKSHHIFTTFMHPFKYSTATLPYLPSNLIFQ